MFNRGEIIHMLFCINYFMSVLWNLFLKCFLAYHCKDGLSLFLFIYFEIELSNLDCLKTGKLLFK